MRKQAHIAVIVPAFNERNLIAQTLAQVPSRVDRIVVVDDGSSDDTAAVARTVDDPRVIVVQHEENRGVGAALTTGYRACFEAGAEVAVVMAGDGQMHPDDFDALVSPVLSGEVDYAKGDRLSWPGARDVMPPMRWLGNHVLSSLTRLALGSPVRDSQCGYTALRRSAAARIDLDALWPRYGYPNDLIARLLERGCRVRDVAVRPVYAEEKSGIGWRHALVVIPFVLTRALARRAKRPLRDPARV